MQYGNNPTGFEHHDPNVKDGPVTEIVKSAVKSKAGDKLGKGFDAAWEKGAKFFTQPSIAPSALQTAALQTGAAAAPAGLGIAPGAAAAITGNVGTGAALAGAAAPAAVGTTAVDMPTTRDGKGESRAGVRVQGR